MHRVAASGLTAALTATLVLPAAGTRGYLFGAALVA
jgi:hypothetical protein